MNCDIGSILLLRQEGHADVQTPLPPILLLTPGAGQTPACRNRRSPYLLPRRPAQHDYRRFDPTEAPCCSGLRLEVKSANHPTEPQEVIPYG
ncbi:conserved domain protein [Actinomyces sp. oral taxon 170 str. F0386]|nr:conserved domain protein [Actinomyces sp. oral taxon 170 str. F0386]